MTADEIVVSLRRDAALYLNMLLGDQILNMVDCKTTCQLDEMLSAYTSAKEGIERALRRSPSLPPSAVPAADTAR